jgi:predicted ATPase
MGGAAAGHEGHGGTTASAPAQIALPKLALSGAAKPVFENYLAAQASLAGDSMEKISASASALVQVVRTDTAKTFPTEVATQAEALAEAKDLAAARKAFRPLSESLIRYAKAGNIPAGTLYEVYCPMAKASWLQADKTVRNPYFGQSMLDCGQIKN